MADTAWSLTDEGPAKDDGAAELAVEVRGAGPDGELLPVRVTVTASDGSHPDGSGCGVYADGRFFAEGPFEVKVPPGLTRVHLDHGPSYVPLDVELDAAAGRRHRVQARMRQWFSPEERGWYSGDNHIHAQHDVVAQVRTSLRFCALQARANGLSFVTEAGSHTSYEELGRLSTATFLFRVARELGVGPFVGHLNTPGIRQPLEPDDYERLAKQPLPALALTEAVHALGGTVTRTHPLAPEHQLHWMGATEVLSDAVLGRVGDAFDVDSRHTEWLWFAALNLGSRVGCSSYTDGCLGRKHTLSPGDRRVYCRAEGLSYEAVAAALRAGRTFATNAGPLFAFLSVDGREPGDTLPAAAGHTVRAEVHSLHPLAKLELYAGGKLAHSFAAVGRKGETVFTHPYRTDSARWCVLRAEDAHGHWAITSPVYLGGQAPAGRPFASALALQISNCDRYTGLERRYFAHLIATVPPGEVLGDVSLLKDGQPLRRFTPQAGSWMPSRKTPVTEREGRYELGWVWHPDEWAPHHFQADWPVDEPGWYALSAATESGRKVTSDALHFDPRHLKSHELSVAHLAGGETGFHLWGYGEDMPLAGIREPFEGDHWWYPENVFWRVRASFGNQMHDLSGGPNTQGARLFRQGTPSERRTRE